MNKIVSLLLIVMLSGCNLFKKYDPHIVDLSEQYADEINTTHILKEDMIIYYAKGMFDEEHYICTKRAFLEYEPLGLLSPADDHVVVAELEKGTPYSLEKVELILWKERFQWSIPNGSKQFYIKIKDHSIITANYDVLDFF